MHLVAIPSSELGVQAQSTAIVTTVSSEAPPQNGTVSQNIHDYLQISVYKSFPIFFQQPPSQPHCEITNCKHQKQGCALRCRFLKYIKRQEFRSTQQFPESHFYFRDSSTCFQVKQDQFLTCTPSAIPVGIINSSSNFGSARDDVLSAQGIYLKHSGLCTNTDQKNSKSYLHKDKTGGYLDQCEGINQTTKMVDLAVQKFKFMPKSR